MDDHKYTELFILQSSELTGLTPFCPEDQQIAEYFELKLPRDEQAQLERHLVDCSFCLARVGILGRLESDRPDIRIPGEVLATAKAIAGSGQGRWRRLAPAWAVAALIVLSVGILPQLHSTRQMGRAPASPVNTVEKQNDLRVTRSTKPTATGPEFLSPPEGLVINPADYLFRWAPVPHSRFYQLRIIADNGDLLWQERITGNEWQVPAGMNLAPGVEYFVRVEAFLADTRSLKSDYLPFQVEERR